MNIANEANPDLNTTAASAVSKEAEQAIREDERASTLREVLKFLEEEQSDILQRYAPYGGTFSSFGGCSTVHTANVVLSMLRANIQFLNGDASGECMAVLFMRELEDRLAKERAMDEKELARLRGN